MHRHTTDKLEKENQSTFSRNPKVPIPPAKTVKNEFSTKGRLTVEKPITTTSQRNVVKPATDLKKVHISKPSAPTDAAKGKCLVKLSYERL